MDQITKSVNKFLSMIVGGGLICFTAFVFLLASAQLNDSRLGDLLAGVAGETARTARTESFSYWERVGREVADGLGYGQILGGGGGTTVIVDSTPVNTGSGPTATPRPNVTQPPPAPTLPPIQANAALKLWRGLDANGQIYRWGVSLSEVDKQVEAALTQNPNDPLAKWLKARLQLCVADNDAMILADYEDPKQATTIITAADNLLLHCNPRIFEAIARKRWAELTQWTEQTQFDETRADALLAGLPITIGSKQSGPARLMLPGDQIEIRVEAIQEFALGALKLNLTAATLDRIIGEGEWAPNMDGIVTISGEFLPLNPPEPIVPTDAELYPPTPTPSADGGVESNTVGGGDSSTPTNNGKYIVQAGDTANSIARKFNITLEALIAANPVALANPSFIVPGQELIIPGAK